MKKVTAYIGMGSNLGDGKTTLMEAWEVLGDIEGITLDKISSPYKTAPVEMTSQHWFTNAVGRLKVDMSPLQLLESLLAVEATFGRARKSGTFGYQDRSLDLDLLYFGDTVMDSPDLTVPHPRIGGRLFVLEPLAELAPDFSGDPADGRTARQLAQDLRKKLTSKEGKAQEIIRDTWDEEPKYLGFDSSKNGQKKDLL
jgi:2-amino-4-hydroxy-6-hydroxymethyldihydropteridine diphosphokinase